MNEERPFAPEQPTPPGVTPVYGAETTTRRAVWLHLTLVFAIVALLLGLHILFPTLAVLLLRERAPAFLTNDPLLATYLLDLVPFYVVAIPLCAFLLSRLAKQTPARESMAPLAYLGWLCVGLTFAAAGNLIGQAVTGIITALTGSAPTSANDLLGRGSMWWALLFIGVLAPVFEEIIFRKFVVDALRRYGEGTAILLSAMIFGLAHGNFTQCFYTFGLGLILAVFYCRTGKLIASILPHMALNTCSTLLSFFVLPRVLELSDLAHGPSEELLEVFFTYMPALLVFLAYTAVFYGGALTGLILFILRIRKTRFAPSPLLLEAEAGGFYRPLRGTDVRAALVRSPGFWVMIAVVAFQFVMSVIPA